MTQKSQQVRLRLGRNARLAIIILGVALCGTIAQPALARGRPVEIADAAIQRDWFTNASTVERLRLTSIVLRRPPAHCLLSFGFMVEAGARAEKSSTVRLSVS